MENEKLTDEVKSVTKEAPIADAVNKIAEHVVKSEKRTTERVEEIETATKRGLEDLSDKMTKGFTDAAEGIDRMRKNLGQNSLSSLNVENVTDPLIEAMPTEVRKDIGRFAQVAGWAASKGSGESSILAKPEVACGVDRWFRLATKMQHRRFAAQQTELHDEFRKLDKGFHEMGNRVLKAASSLQEDTNAEGGFLVPTIVAAEINRQILDAGRVYPLARQVPLSTKTTKLPAQSGSVTVTWVEEESSLVQSGPEFSQLTLQAEKLAARSTMSIELLEDSNVALLPWLLSVFTENMAAELDKQVAAGDGSGPVITGIANGTSIVAITSGTAAGRALTYPLLVQAYQGATQLASREDAVWIVSPAGFQELLELTDGNGRPLVSLTGAEVRGPAPMTLFGKRIIESGSVGGAADPSLDDSTNTNTTILFGPMRSYAFGTRQGMRWDVTDQVSWATYQMDARLVGRWAGVPAVSANFVKLTHITTA